MKKSESPSPEEFEGLLAWLDPDDRDRAGVILLEIRSKLVKILEWRQCWEADDLADETINRVSHKVNDISPTYEGDPALFFLGFMRNIYREWLKSRKNDPVSLNDVVLSAPEPDDKNVELILGCLDKCREELDKADRDLILRYYENEKRAKIDHRKQLADDLGITMNNLRMRIHRINARLHKCIDDCLGQSEPVEIGYVLAG